jgi:kynurenine formamidase
VCRARRIDAAQYLAHLGVKMGGIGAITSDQLPFPFHKALFEAETFARQKPHGLAGLEDKDFTVYVCL